MSHSKTKRLYGNLGYMRLSRRRLFIEAIGVTLFFVLATIPMYYPISLNLGSMIFDRWDGFLHTWILAWDVHKLTTGLGGFWDGNIFWPHHDAIAYSDHLLSSAFLAAPFLLISHNPIMAHNAVTYLGFVIGGLGMFLLVRRLTGHGWASLIAAMIYVYCPWRFGQMGHETQLLSSQWLPFSLLFLHRSIHEKRFRDGIFTGLFFGLHALSSFYMAAMGSVVMAAFFAVEFIRSRGRLPRAVWMKLVTAGVIVSAMIAPTIPPYYRVAKTQGMMRTVSEAESMSADPLDYFCAPPWNRLLGAVTAPLKNRYSPFPNENRLFAGFTVLVLACAGLFLSSPRKWEFNQVAFLCVTALCFIFSLGPFLHVAWHRFQIPLPYLAAYHFVPGFKGLRVPARFASMVELGLAVLAAYGFIRISGHIRNKTGRIVFGLAIPAAIFAEFFSAPLPHHRIRTGNDIPEVYKWLAAQPGDFAVFEAPQLPGFDWLPEKMRPIGDPLGFSYIYYSTYHWKKLANGRSGFIPHTSMHIYKAMMKFPSASTVNTLRYLGVKYLVLHTDAYVWDNSFDPARYAEEVGKFLPVTTRFGSDIVYEVPNPMGDEQRRNLNNIELAEFFAPPHIKPGAKFNIELCLSNPGDIPIYSFGLVDIETSAEIKGLNEIIYQSRKERNIILLDPHEKEWFTLTLTAPEFVGSYSWSVNLTVRGSTEFRKRIEFQQDVGAYPDSGAPDLLKASFLELDIPISLKPNQIFEVRAVVRNDGDTLWRARPFDDQADFHGVVTLCLSDWRDSDGNNVNRYLPPYRATGFLQKSVPPGETAELKLTAMAPDIPGKYKVSVQMVDEYITTFEYSGGEKIAAEIEVKP